MVSERMGGVLGGVEGSVSCRGGVRTQVLTVHKYGRAVASRVLAGRTVASGAVASGAVASMAVARRVVASMAVARRVVTSLVRLRDHKKRTGGRQAATSRSHTGRTHAVAHQSHAGSSTPDRQ